MPRHLLRLLLPVLWLVLPKLGFALGQVSYVETQPSKGCFSICTVDGVAALDVDTNDFPGVVRAAGDLAADIARVTGRTPPLLLGGKIPAGNLILIGAIGHSRIIDQLVHEGKIDCSPIAGKWETFFTEVVVHPFPGIERALVICGSDQRGAIYGIYDLSEQLGVSPWHFFADVLVPHQDQVFVRAGKFMQGPPAVKYRGIFLNDEAPDLTGWVKEHYGDYNHGFYTNIFELLLRLKANYLWPAMWNNCFNEDDPLNYQLASEYGLVLGTSHVEPLMRADKEWNRRGFTQRDWNFQTHSNELLKFWRAGLERNQRGENLLTIAMRGKIDTPMSETANIALLEEIVAAQRQLIAEVYRTNAAAVPQLWALYKEVQEYYEKGMRVPDDVTLLWCDDNWGNLRRLPASEDRQRPGGSGIYYHFDYVGGPRNYKWVNTTALPRVWEQMQLAHAYGANQIWIANVGHLQHVQLPTEFFLTLAWNPERWGNGSIPEFMQLWATREFGGGFTLPIAQIVSQFTKYNARRKPELLSPDTFSVVNYQEADRVLTDWQRLADAAQTISEKLPAQCRDAFFELVLYPVKACANLNHLYIAAAKNRLYAAQGRASANELAAEVKQLMQADADLTDQYNHKLAGGKWNHMMDQTHIGYTGWQQPDSNVMPRVVELELPEAAKMGVAIEGSTNVWPGDSQGAVLPVFDRFNQPSRYLDVFNQGRAPFEFSATASEPWISLSTTGGVVEKERRIWINVDWKNAPRGQTSGFVNIVSSARTVAVRVPVFNPSVPWPDSFHGFVEAGGCVSLEAEHFTKKLDSEAAHWEKIDDLGNTVSAMTLFPLTAASMTPPDAWPPSRAAGWKVPCLEYEMYLFDAGKVQVESRLAPTLNFAAGRGLRFALSFDAGPPKIVTAVPANYAAGDVNHDWQGVVSDNIRKVRTAFELAKAGRHTLKFWMVDPGVVLERIVVDCGGEQLSYLGPPESFREQSP